MNRAEYISLRSKYKFEINSFYLSAHYLIDASLLAAITCLNQVSAKEFSYYSFLAIPMIVVLMFRNFSLMHEATHSLVSKNKNLNFIVGLIAGGFSLLPFEPWKRVHMKHHYWSGNMDKDPVMALIIQFPKYSLLKQTTINLLWKLWIPIIAYLQHWVFWSTSVQELRHSGFSFKMILSLVFPIILWSWVIYSLVPSFVAAILLPSIFLYLLTAEIVNLPHHLDLICDGGEYRLSPLEQHRSARSCIYPKAVEKFMTLNFNYHIEHHMFPDAPWYYLRDLHSDVEPKLQQAYNSDMGITWVLKNRKLLFSSILEMRGAQKSHKHTA